MITTSFAGYVDAQLTTDGSQILISMCQYPVSGSTVITKDEAKQLADLLYEIAGAGRSVDLKEAA